MMEKTFGNINSIENCSTISGPGVRFTVHLQGCPIRCMYCKDVDKWSMNVNKKMDSNEILEKYEKVKSALIGGGLSVTGGEPLLQLDFVIDLFKKAKQKNINTTLITSGLLFEPSKIQKYEELLKYCDLIILDFKHSDPLEHKKLTFKPIEILVEFVKFLENHKKGYRMRHVAIPGVTLQKVYLENLGRYMAPLKYLIGFEVLPYLKVALEKYENIGAPCPFKAVPSLTPEQLKIANDIVLDSYKKAKERI